MEIYVSHEHGALLSDSTVAGEIVATWRNSMTGTTLQGAAQLVRLRGISVSERAIELAKQEASAILFERYQINGGIC